MQSDGARGQDPEKPVSSQASPRPAPSETNRWQTRAVMLCKDKEFQAWVPNRIGRTDEEIARNYILYKCGILSRAELATNPEAQKRFLLLEAQCRAEVGE
jgi:hypothetical protein